MFEDDRQRMYDDLACTYGGPGTIDVPIIGVTNDQIMEELRAIRQLLTESLRVATNTTADEFLTIPQAAKEFRIHPKTLYRRKHLHVRIGKRSIRIRRSSLTRRDLLAA